MRAGALNVHRHATAWHAHVMLLCHAVPCCAMLCHAVPCSAMLCHGVPCWATLHGLAVPWRAMALASPSGLLDQAHQNRQTLAAGLLFLDEPTTGLDATNAAKVVDVLAGLAAGGVNTVLSIHQPRPDIFRLMDRVLLLSGAVQLLGLNH